VTEYTAHDMEFGGMRGYQLRHRPDGAHPNPIEVMGAVEGVYVDDVGWTILVLAGVSIRGSSEPPPTVALRLLLAPLSPMGCYVRERFERGTPVVFSGDASAVAG
jgi:hypothetical protein